MSLQQVARYQIRSQLGEGGMATVYLAYDPNFEREVALKVLPTQFLHDPTFRKRFEQEARTIAKLEHHAIVPVYDFGEENGQPFIVMRLMKGGTLTERLAQGALTLTEAARILAWLAPGLDEAHQRGIIHRDLKPANMLFDLHDKPRIADFGIAKLTQATSSFKTGGIIGTPHYMSPEQWNGLALDGRSDIYALGVILFEMLTSQCPYDASSSGAIMKMHLMDPVPNILLLRNDLPVGLQPIIEQAMAKDRTKRYSTVGALSHALEQLVVATSAPTLSQPQPQSKSSNTSSQKWFLWRLMLAVILLIFGSSYYYFSFDSSAIKTQVSAKDGMRMLYVPEGVFLMGAALDTPGTDDDEKPQRKVYLDAFWIDQTEVTNEMFERFVSETGYKSEAEKEGWGWVCFDGNCNKAEGANWLHPHGAESNLDGLEKHPVVQVSWHDAQAYCQWAERRLPTEAEWEKAARGTEGDSYPWGKQDITGVQLNFCDRNCPLPNADQSIDDGYEFTAPVGSYPAGASPYNALDMAGNVWEWVADWYDERYYQNAPLGNPQGPDDGESRTQRSGSWDNEAALLKAANRVPALPSDRNYSRGFRCAASP